MKEFIANLEVHNGIPKTPGEARGGQGGVGFTQKTTVVVEGKTAKEAMSVVYDMFPCAINILSFTKV